MGQLRCSGSCQAAHPALGTKCLSASPCLLRLQSAAPAVNCLSQMKRHSLTLCMAKDLLGPVIQPSKPSSRNTLGFLALKWWSLLNLCRCYRCWCYSPTAALRFKALGMPEAENEREERGRKGNLDLMMVAAAKPAASFFLSVDRPEESTGKAPSICHQLELADSRCMEKQQLKHRTMYSQDSSQNALHCGSGTQSITMTSELRLR